ncbi:MAG: carbohydrate binding domain-containing protein, partial [Clostridia bacterium]|nr:carbohydrate binding domain-containing protein [Clostridia bacterium]
MNMRKIIAVLAAVLMLCAIIPMSAMVSAASIFNVNFDDGEVVFAVNSSDTAVVEDGVLHWTTVGWKNLYKSFNGVAGTEYVLTVKAKASKAVDLKFVFHNGSWSGYVAPDYVPRLTTEWATYTYRFSPTEKGMVLLLQAKGAAEIWLDDIKVTEYVAPVDPVFPEDAIYTETFESATAAGWSASTSSIVETADLDATKADGGNYAMQFVSAKNPDGTGGYQYTNYKLTVTPDTDYKVTYSILSGVSGMPLNARVRASDDLGLLKSTPGTAAWETHTYTFNSGSNTSVNLRFQAGWATGTYYIDNISVAPYDASTISNDGHVSNGTFESGDTANWAPSANVAVVADPTSSNQGYVIKTSETSANAVMMFKQVVQNLVVGKEYTLNFKVYSYAASDKSAAFWVRLPSTFTTWSVNTNLALGTANSGADYTARINVNKNVNAWHNVAMTFTAQDTSAEIQFMNYRSGQGFYYFDDITLSHAYDATVTDPDCVNDGSIVYTCACGDTYTETTPAKGHTAGAAADCDSAQVCTVCGAELTAALGHNWNAATCTTPKTCATCGATEGDALGHTPGAAADCENAQTCTVCGAELTAALGHDWDDATCTAPKTCATCGATEGEALGHSYNETAREEATCGADGSVTYTCANCGDSYTDTIPATGEHVYFDDCSAICEVCGYEREAGHNVIHVEAKAATCTEMGNIEYWYCDVCGMAWLDEACTMNTNLRAVNLPMA